MDIKKNFLKGIEYIKTGAVELKDKAKTAYKKSSLNSELSEMYETLGKIRYNAICQNIESPEEEAQIVSEITRIEFEIEQIRLKGNKICENCGKEIPEEAEFCPFCGLKQNKTEDNGNINEQ